MSEIHTIRLRGPWQYEVLARYELQADGTSISSAADLPSPGRVTMPSDWRETLGGDFRGRVRYRRVFHWPSQLMPDEAAWLVVESTDLVASVLLDGQVLGEVRRDGPPSEFDITSCLQPDHELIIEVDLPGGQLGEVRLEIRT